MSESQKLPAPVQLAYSTRAGSAPNEVIITGVRLPLGDLIVLFIKLWLASLIAAFLIAIIPVMLLVLLNQVPGVFKH